MYSVPINTTLPTHQCGL